MKKIIVLVCLLLCGCSAKFAYNNASWLVYWYLDDYVELNSDQEEVFDAMLDTWLIWHKQEELPRYKLHFEDLISDIRTNKINVDTIAAHKKRAREHWLRVREYVAPDLVALGASLSPQQIMHLFSALEKDNTEVEEEYSELSEQEKIKKWTKRSQKGTKKWLGKLSQEQNELIATYHNKFEETELLWVAYKREYQKKLQQVFLMENRDELFQSNLYALIVEPEKYRSESFQTIIDANSKASSEYILGLLALTTNKQRMHLIEEIDDFKLDVIQLQK